MTKGRETATRGAFSVFLETSDNPVNARGRAWYLGGVCLLRRHSPHVSRPPCRRLRSRFFNRDRVPRPREIATVEVTMIDLESKDKLDLTSPNGHAVLQTIKLVDQH